MKSILKKFTKQTLFLLLIGFNLVACKTPQENLQDLKEKKVAAVISGCRFTDGDKKSSCETKWRLVNDLSQVYYAGHRFVGYTSVTFIPPGTYTFYNMCAYSSDKLFCYTRGWDKPSMLTNFTVSGGEVVYIGDFEIDISKTRLMIHAIKPFYAKDNTVYLKKYFPTYFNDESNFDIQDRVVSLTPIVKFAKKYIPMIEGE
jgi:hypothetical protein